MRTLMTSSILCLLLAVTMSAQGIMPDAEDSTPYSIAHRGCHIDGLVPENSIDGVEMAAKYGFRAIECDVHYTRDSIMILMHDSTINRTCRQKEGYLQIGSPVRYSDLDFESLRRDYVLASDDPSLRSQIPTFEEELLACKQFDIVPLIHSDLPEAYQLAYDMLGDNFIAFDSNYESMQQARRISEGCLILWDPGTRNADEVIEMLKAIGGRCGVSSMKKELLTSEYVSTLREAGLAVQESIWSSPWEMDGVDRGCNIVLSDFSLFSTSESRAEADIQNIGISGRTLEAGESLYFDWEDMEFGSIEISLELSGSVDIQINGTYDYALSGEGIHRTGGWRFYDKGAEIKVTAKEKTLISHLIVNVLCY